MSKTKLRSVVQIVISDAWIAEIFIDSVVKPISVVEGITSVTLSAREGYSFNVEYDDDGGETVYTFSKPVTVSLYKATICVVGTKP